MAKKKTRNALTYETLPALFTGICDAIRTKTGGSDPIPHQSIPDMIENIAGGSVTVLFNNIEQNKKRSSEFSFTATKTGNIYIAGYFDCGSNDGYADVLVNNVSVGSTGRKFVTWLRTRNECIFTYVIPVTENDSVKIEALATPAEINGMTYALLVLQEEE